MKKFKHFSMAVVVTIMLAVHAFAGDIGIPVAPPPPATSSAPVPGDIHIPVTGATLSPGASSSLTDIALSLLQTVLSVF